MTKQQKIGATILIGILVLGIIFKFFNPVIALICLAMVAIAIYSEVVEKSKQNPPPTIEDVQRKYPKRKSQEQIRTEKLKERRAAYDRDLANRMRAKGMTQSTAPQKNTDSAKYKKLLVMLGGDRVTADRLVSAYGIDRAISDLERDRRIY